MFYALEWHPGIGYWKAILRGLQVWNSICRQKCQSACTLFTLESNLAQLEMIQYVKFWVKACRTKRILWGSLLNICFLLNPLPRRKLPSIKSPLSHIFLLYISPMEWVKMLTAETIISHYQWIKGLNLSSNWHSIPVKVSVEWSGALAEIWAPSIQ